MATNPNVGTVGTNWCAMCRVSNNGKPGGIGRKGCGRLSPMLERFKAIGGELCEKCHCLKPLPEVVKGARRRAQEMPGQGKLFDLTPDENSDESNPYTHEEK